MNPSTCIFIGRFQPFHRGHKSVVQGMMKLCSKVIIGIGSAQFSRTDFNPFTVDERRQIIGASLEGEAGIDMERLQMIEIPDQADDQEWVHAILSQTGHDVTVWSGNDYTAKLFEDRGIPVQRIQEVPGLSATHIRSQMVTGEPWEDQVGPEVAKLIKDRGLVEVIKQSRGKTDPAENPQLWQ